jgi:hypothetical protein
MKYVPPYGTTSPNPDSVAYINGDPSIGRQGSIPPAAVFENPQREIVNLINDSTQTPIDEDLHQTTRAVRDGKLNFCVDSGPLNQLQIVMPGPPIQAYTAGLTVRILVAHTNTGPVRITIGTLNPTALKRPDGSELAANDILAGQIATCVSDGTYFQLQNIGPSTGGGAPSVTMVDIPYVHDTSVNANRLIGLFSPPLIDIREGRTVEVKVLNNITGPTTFIPNNFPEHNVAHPDGSPLKAGDLVNNQIALLCFDGVQWQLLGVYFSVPVVPPVVPSVATGKSLKLWYRQPDQSSHLRRIPSINGNHQVFTVSMFYRRNDLGIAGVNFGGSIAQGVECPFSCGQAAATWGGTPNAAFYLGVYMQENWYNNAPSFQLTWNFSQVANSSVGAPGLFARNIAADTKWHHWLLSGDGALFSLWVDGVLTNQAAVHGDTPINSTLWHEIGTVSDYGSPGFSYNEYYGCNWTIAEFYLLDGYCQTFDKFSQNIGGVVLPKTYSGPWGTNGCYLNFSDSSAATETTLGKDQSGNGNNWVPYNISNADVTTDYPRGN